MRTQKGAKERIEVRFAQRHQWMREIADGLSNNRQTDPRYPLEVVEHIGISVPGNRPGQRTAGHVSSLTESFTLNQRTGRKAVRVRRKAVKGGREVYIDV